MVVPIDCLSQAPTLVALRPLLNYKVTLFVFLLGYLTSREKAADAGCFFQRRLGKAISLYVVWTAFSLAARGLRLRRRGCHAGRLGELHGRI